MDQPEPLQPKASLICVLALRKLVLGAASLSILVRAKIIPGAKLV